VFVENACYILRDGDAVRSSGVLDKASVVGKVNDLEQYVLKVPPVEASATAASTRIAGEAELWLRRFNHLGLENLKRAATMVDGMPSSVADAKRVIGTVCVPCVDGKMVQAPSARSSTATTKCELVHTGIGGPLTESLGSSIYFMTALEDSTGFITATPIKTKMMAPHVLKTRIKQLETLTGVKVKRVRHDCRQASSMVRYFASFVALAALLGHMWAASAGLVVHQGWVRRTWLSSDAHAYAGPPQRSSFLLPAGVVYGTLLCLVCCRCGALRAHVGRARGLSLAPGMGAQDVYVLGRARVRRTAVAQPFYTAGRRRLWYATLPRFLPLRRSQGPCERVQ